MSIFFVVKKKSFMLSFFQFTLVSTKKRFNDSLKKNKQTDLFRFFVIRYKIARVKVLILNEKKCYQWKYVSTLYARAEGKWIKCLQNILILAVDICGPIGTNKTKLWRINVDCWFHWWPRPPREGQISISAVLTSHPR